jgi:hypothetical protein
MEGAAPAQLRRFGLTVGGAFMLLGLVSWARGHAAAPWVLWTLGGLLAVPALAAPGVLGPVQRVWMGAARVLGEVNSRVILTAFFYLVLAPVGLVLRRVRDPLDRSLDDGRTSNWIKRAPAPVDRARYERQF